MEKKITVREGFNRLADLFDEGKGSWELEMEDTKTGKKLKDVQLVAIKSEETLTCLFG